MEEYREKNFRLEQYHERGPLVIQDCAFVSCVFDNCSIGAPSSALGRSIIRNVRIEKAVHIACGVNGAIIDTVTVSGLARQGRIPLFLSGVAFRRTTLSGKIHLFKLQSTPWVAPTQEQILFWNGVNTDFYREVDWALDISQAHFTFGPDLHFVPGHLVRINPEHQAIVTRAELTGLRLAELEVPGSALHIALKWFLDYGPYETAAIAAGGAAKSFAADVQFIRSLRARGLASSAGA